MTKSALTGLADIWDRARSLHQQGQLLPARELYLEVLGKRPDHFEALNLLGVLSGQLNDLPRAVQYFERALAVEPNNPAPYCNRGLALKELGRLDEALASFDQAIEINPGFIQALFNRGVALQQLGHFDAALASFDRMIAIQPNDALCHLYRGNALKALNRLQAALASYDRALAIKPDFAEACSNRGIVLCDLNEIDAALASYDRAIELQPGYAATYFNRASALRLAKRFDAAAADYKRAATLAQDIKFLPGAHLEARMHTCDWDGFDAEVALVEEAIERGEAASHPFSCLAFSDSPRTQRRAAEIWVRETCPANPLPGTLGGRGSHGKTRIGYFSADFREHPVSRLLAELIENHDRSRFEVIAFSWGPATQDDLRSRLERGFDRFLDVHGMSDMDVASLARRSNVDIAIDLGGHTHGSRQNIFALRAAPLQVSYLGYPGTTGAPYMDYLIADATLVPPDDQTHYSEKIIYLPSFQANDSKRRVAERMFTREELGLPSVGFVFCCFNTSYKITPSTMDAWMRILARVPGSVLFLFAESKAAAGNLKKEAMKRGMAADRLRFAKQLPAPEYMARYRVADLFLDTRPYNAGTTASDALWVGLPVLTLAGTTFAGRMAASLLQAIGLPELITSTPAQYEDMAVRLAEDPSRLAAIRRKISHNRAGNPLFDTRSFTGHLEAAYATILERYRAGLPTEHVVVPPAGDE